MVETPTNETERHLTEVVDASVADCFSLACDLENYPDWVDGVKSVEVAETDGQGRATLVSFVAESFGRKITYRLRYSYEGEPNKLSWRLDQSDMLSAMDGKYEFTANPDGQTQIDYYLSTGLKVAVPGFVRRRAEDKIIEMALGAFKRQVEG